MTGGLTIRPAFPDDARALARLAALDCRSLPGGRLLVAEVAGELWAALALDGAEAIADPFRPSAEAVSLLRARARQLTPQPRRRGLLGRVPRLAST